MDDRTFDDRLAQYEAAAESAVEYRESAAIMEIQRADWIAAEAEKLLQSENPRTGKTHSWTSAEAWVRDTREHRDRQEAIAKLEAEADLAQAKARSLFLALRWAIACREGVVHV
jgi:hypothetical protein